MNEWKRYLETTAVTYSGGRPKIFLSIKEIKAALKNMENFGIDLNSI